MGPNLDIKDVEKIESLVKTMDRELTPVEAKIVASMLQVIWLRIKRQKIKYSGDPNSKHSNNGNIRIPNY